MVVSSRCSPGSSRAWRCSWVEPVRSLLEAPSPAVMTTYRKDGSAHTVPVRYRWTGEAFEVVIAKGDMKLRHLARNPQCALVAFEAVRPFRGVEVRGWPSWSRATSRRRGLRSLAAISGCRTASASPPTGGPGQGCSSGSSPTVHGYGTCRESCLPDRPWTASTYRPCVLLGAGPTGSCLPWQPILFGRCRTDHQTMAAVGGLPGGSHDLPIPIGRSPWFDGPSMGRSGHSLGHSPCHNAAGQERTGWTSR